MHEGYRKWRRKLYEKNPDLGYIMMGRTPDGKPFMEVRGIDAKALEEITSRIELAKAVLELRPDMYKEYVKFFLTQLVFRNLTWLEMKTWKVLRSYYGKDKMDKPFKMVEELEKLSKSIFFPHSSKIENFVR